MYNFAWIGSQEPRLLYKHSRTEPTFTCSEVLHNTEAFSVYSSPLSEPVDIIVLEASSRATDGNTINFNSTESTDLEYVHSESW